MSKIDKPIVIAKKILYLRLKSNKRYLRQEMREGKSQEKRTKKKETASVIIVSTPPSKESRSRKRNREMEERVHSTEAVSEAKLE